MHVLNKWMTFRMPGGSRQGCVMLLCLFNLSMSRDVRTMKARIVNVGVDESINDINGS